MIWDWNPGKRGRVRVPAFPVAHLDVPHRQPAEERLPQLQVITIIIINIIFLVKKGEYNWPELFPQGDLWSSGKN